MDMWMMSICLDCRMRNPDLHTQSIKGEQHITFGWLLLKSVQSTGGRASGLLFRTSLLLSTCRGWIGCGLL